MAGVVAGLIFGILGLVLLKPSIIASTGIFGGVGLGYAIGVAADSTSLAAGLAILLSVCGIAYQVYADKQKNSAQDHSSALGKAIKEKISLKIETENKGLESVFYSNTVLKTAMPFAEYILYAIALVLCARAIFGSNIGNLSAVTTLLLLLAALMCALKGKTRSIAIAFGLIAAFRVMAIYRNDGLSLLPTLMALNHIIETALLIMTALSAAYFEIKKAKDASVMD